MYCSIRVLYSSPNELQSRVIPTAWATASPLHRTTTSAALVRRTGRRHHAVTTRIQLPTLAPQARESLAIEAPLFPSRALAIYSTPCAHAQPPRWTGLHSGHFSSVALPRSDFSSALNVLHTVLYHGSIQPRIIGLLGRMGIRKLSPGHRLNGRGRITSCREAVQKGCGSYIPTFKAIHLLSYLTLNPHR